MIHVKNQVEIKNLFFIISDQYVDKDIRREKMLFHKYFYIKNRSNHGKGTIITWFSMIV